jgi:hypothetical protein
MPILELERPEVPPNYIIRLSTSVVSKPAFVRIRSRARVLISEETPD